MLCPSRLLYSYWHKSGNTFRFGSAATILSVLNICGLVTSETKAEDPVYFADPNLKAVVEEELGVPNPTPTDMLALTSLTASHRGIIDLTGLEYATNITRLDLWDNRISDLNPISGLTNLTLLDLWDNQISDMNAVSDLTELPQLDVGRNQINNISAVSGLVKLTVLGLDENQISDISPLLELDKLNTLYVQNNSLPAVAYCIYLPLIEENNPGICLYYDPKPNALPGDCD